MRPGLFVWESLVRGLSISTKSAWSVQSLCCRFVCLSKCWGCKPYAHNFCLGLPCCWQDAMNDRSAFVVLLCWMFATNAPTLPIGPRRVVLIGWQCQVMTLSVQHACNYPDANQNHKVQGLKPPNLAQPTTSKPANSIPLQSLPNSPRETNAFFNQCYVPKVHVIL